MNAALIHVTVWLNLERIMLNQKSQTQKATCCTITITWNVKNMQSIETQCRLVVVWGWGRKKWGHCGFFSGDGNIMDRDSGDHCKRVSVY